MLQILALLLLIGAAASVSFGVYSKREIFNRFGQPTIVGWVIWLYPLPFFLPLFKLPLYKMIFYPAPVGVIFFVPAIISAWVNQKSFEMSGDERVKPALKTVRNALCAGIMGVMGVFVETLLLWVSRFSHGRLIN